MNFIVKCVHFILTSNIRCRLSIDIFQILIMHVCPKCSQNGFVDLAALVSHICLHHGNEPNFSVSCSLHSRVFRNIGSFRSHIYRNHHDEVFKQFGPTAQIVTNIQCPVCGEFVHGGLALLSSHYRVHCDSGQVVKCVVDGCSSEYSTYSIIHLTVVTCPENIN